MNFRVKEIVFLIVFQTGFFLTSLNFKNRYEMFCP